MKLNKDITFELVNFSKKYASNKKFAVKDVSFKVYGGEIFGFLGPNGSGKSTIIKSTVGIQPITEGDILICGSSIKKEPIKAKKNIGYVPDHYALYEQLTGRQYLDAICQIYNVKEKDKQERFNRYISLFKLEKFIDEKMKTYSHGTKQKMTIIATLMHEPKLWILDEPLTGLDPTSIYQVKKCMIEHAKKGNIVFFSSHIIDVVEKLCDRIGIIKYGDLKCVKDVKEIEKTNSLEKFYLKTIE